MEQVNRTRRCRRSIRNLRRSSGVFTDSCTLSLEVEESEPAVNDDEASSYGSIWVDDGRQNKSCNQQALNCAEVGSSDSSKFLKEQDVFSAINSCSKPATEFLDGHNSVVYKECLAQYEPGMSSISLRDITSLSVKDIKSGTVLKQESCNQWKSQLDMNVNFGEDSEPHIGASSVSAYIIPSSLHDYINNDKDVSSANNNFNNSQTDSNTFSMFSKGTMFDQYVCCEGNVPAFTESSKKINFEAFENTDNNLESNFETVNTSCKSSSLNKEVRNNSTEKMQISNIKTQSIISAESRKDRRKSESSLVKLDTSKHPDYEPKKRKRLSLNRIHTNIFEERQCNFVENHVEKYVEKDVEKYVELKENAHIDVVHEEVNEDVDSAIYNACTSELKDIKKGTEQDGLDLMDLEISEDMLKYFDPEEHLPSPHKVTSEKKSKKSKAKATRRSSRLFHLHEMPLSNLSLEQIPNVRLSSPEINDSTAEVGSPKFSKYCGEENKENERLKELRNVWSLEDNSRALLDNTVELEDSQLLDVAFIEEALEDFANLTMNDKACTTDIIGLSHQTRRQSDGSRRSGIYEARIPSTESCKDTDENKDCMLINCQQNDNSERCISSLSAFNSPENVSLDTDVRCNNDSSAFYCKSENIFKDIDNKENGSSFLGFISSTSEADVDMDELPSPGSTSAKDSTPPIDNSESKMCMRVRRSRNSWGTFQQSDLDKEKKPPRQINRQKKIEKQSLHTSDNSQFSVSLDDERVQSSDNETSSEMSQFSDDDKYNMVSPGLLCLYQNKNFVMPQPKSWQTIKESPKSGKQIFTKQRRKCFLDFENSLTNAKLQRRHKKAIDIYKRIVVKPVALTNEDFERKMLDTQLLLESL